MSQVKEEKKKKIKVSSIVDGALLVLAGAMIALELTLFITTKKDGMPSLFGKTFMRVLTGSMDGPNTPEFFLTRAGNDASGRVTGVYETKEEAEKARSSSEGVFTLEKKGPWMLGINTAAVLERKAFEDVEPGDIVTFYYDLNEVYTHQLVSHRVIEIIDSTLYCYGDAYPKNGYPYSSSSSSYTGVQKITKSDYVGTIVSKSDFFGGVMTMTSSVWFVPVVVGVPLLSMAGFSVADSIKQARLAKKEEEAKIQEMVLASGVDPNDERAVAIEKEKAAVKLEIQEELQKEKEKQKELFRKQFEKEKEEALKLAKKEMDKEEKQ